MKKLFVLIIVMWLVGASRFAVAQVDDDSVRLEGSARIAGTGRYRAGEWASVTVHVVNGSDQDQTPQTICFLEQHPLMQFGSQVLVPARSVRAVTHPIYIPEDVEEDVKWLKLLTTVVEDADAGEVVQRQRDGELFQSGLIPLTGVAPETAWFASDGQGDAAVYEAVIAVRTDLGLDRRVGRVTEFPPPTNPLVYSGTEQVIIADDNLARDPATAGTIRRWLLDGGHLWVFLDLVGQPTLEQLLGNQCRVEHVDRITLTDLTIVPTNDWGSSPDSREFEEPVAMARVLVDDLEVTHTINGWPAAIRQSFGRGHVFFTTLAARGWLRERGPNDPQPNDETRGSYYVPLASLRNARRSIYEGGGTTPAFAGTAQTVPARSDWVPHRRASTGGCGSGRVLHRAVDRRRLVEPA